MSITNNTKIQIVLDSRDGRIVDILKENDNSSRYRSKKAYEILTMDRELFDKLNSNNAEIQGFDPRPTVRIPAQRSASRGSSGDDGWYYNAISGCGEFSHDERVELDKVRPHTRCRHFTFGSSVYCPEYKTPLMVDGSYRGGKWNGVTLSCAEESIYFNGNGGQVVLPSRGGHAGSTSDNWLLSGWFYFVNRTSINDGILIGKLDTSASGYTGPESGASGPTGGFSGGSGDCFMLNQEGSSVKFHWSDAADTSVTGLVNNVTITTVTNATTGPTSGANIPHRRWHHIAVAYRNSAAGSTVTAYVNGIRTVNQSTNGGGIKLNPHPFVFGGRFDPSGPNDHNNNWFGYMDEIVIGCTAGTSLCAGASAEILNTENQKGNIAGSTTGLGDETWRPGYAYYIPARGTSGCQLFDVQSGNVPHISNREFYEGIVTIWNTTKKRLFLRNTTGTGGYDYPTIGGGFITGMSCAAHYAVQSTGGASGSGGSGGLDVVSVIDYQSIIRNTLESDTEDLTYARLYGQTHNPGPTGSSDNAFCTLFFGDGSSAGFSGTTGYFGPAGETHTGTTGGGSFSFVTRPEAMGPLGELVTSINAGTSSGSCGSYAIENAEGHAVKFSGTEVIRLWGDLTEFRRQNVENEKSQKDKVVTITALVDGKTILDARVTSLANATAVTLSKGTYVTIQSASQGSGYGFGTG
jgi:hypothetical protein